MNHFTDSNLYMGTAFKLTYPSIDNFTDTPGEGCPNVNASPGPFASLKSIQQISHFFACTGEMPITLMDCTRSAIVQGQWGAPD